MGFIFSIFILTVLVMGTGQLWRRLPEGGSPEAQHWFRMSMLKGVVTPILIWTFFNSGLLLPPLIPQIEMARAGWPRVSIFFHVLAIGIMVIGSCWAAVTLGWLMAAIVRRLENPREFVVTSSIWSLLLVPLAWALVYFEGWGFVGFAGVLWFGPVAHVTVTV